MPAQPTNDSVKQNEATVQDAIELSNSLGELATSLLGGVPATGLPGVQLSQTDTLWINNRWYLISNLRQLLSELYIEHGIVQTLVDQPVDDAYAKGITVETSELSPDQIDELIIYAEQFNVIETVMQARKWTRLFGGGAILIITDQNPLTPININKIKEDSPLEFRAVDMWELYTNQLNWDPDLDPGGALGDPDPAYPFFDYYGKKVHESRVIAMKGKECPSIMRPRLRGWGMSELERLVRSMNQYMKNQDVIFELLDEAKVDVYKIKGFNTALLNKTGTKQMSKRIQDANIIKNYNNALTMDSEDDYAQKQIAFTGLAEVLVQIRQGIAADLKMPVTKLFGISAAGFNSGEDDIENYNSMIEGQVRAKDKFKLVYVLQICCQKLFGYMPQDLQVVFPSLRILNSVEEEEVKNHQFNRLMAAYESGLVPQVKEIKQGINSASLLTVQITEDDTTAEPVGTDDLAKEGEGVDEPAK